MKIVSTISVLFLLSVIVFGQSTQIEEIRGVEIPSKYISLLLVQDPNCPIQLSGPTKIIRFENKTFSYGLTVQNSSTKTIRSFSVQYLSWFGNESLTETFKINENATFPSYLTYSTAPENYPENLIAFDERKAREYGLSDHPHKILVVMVDNVTFDDGTSYDISGLYKLLERFVGTLKLDPAMSTFEINAEESKLNDFIEKLMNRGN